MKIALVYVRDMNFCRIVPERLKPPGDTPWLMGFPPLGILMLSAVLKRAGHQVELFDTGHPKHRPDDIVRWCETQEPDLVGLSFLSTTVYHDMRALARAIKARRPTQKIAIGGVFATMNAPQIARECDEVDYVCRGEGEELILELLANLETPDKVGGLAYKRNGKVTLTPPRPQIANLDKLPFPDRAGLDLEFYEAMPLDVPCVLSLERYTTVQTSRGCPYPCVYCDIPAFSEGKWRDRSPEHVLAELEQLDKEGYGACYFTDDHFLLKRKRIEAICNGIQERKLKIQWGCEGRVDAVAIDQFENMAKANCRTLMFGIESGVQKTLDRLKKCQTLEQITNACNLAKKAGIPVVHGFFLVGCPDETEEEILETFRFCARNKIDTFNFNRLCVYRGTPLWHEYIERGLIDDVRDWNKYFKCSDIDPTILEGEKINELRQKGLAQLLMYRLRHRPLPTLRLLRTIARYMQWSDVAWLLVKPFFKTKMAGRPALPEQGSKALGVPRKVGGEPPREAALAPRGKAALDALDASFKRAQEAEEHAVAGTGTALPIHH
ncbi:MAG TPA: radical SAM protein [Planctomycetota bacterium]|nr:radical SAM protein [Planctomycetota bacterium]